MSRAKQTTARLVDQRARGRADTRLRKRHQQEWNELYVEEKALAEMEAGRLAIVAREKAAAAPPPAEHVHEEPAVPEPPRLKTGRRNEGESAIDRLDVARCPFCRASHDRGHVCPRCGAKPKLDFAGKVREVHRLFDAGTSVDIISMTLSIPKDHVLRLIEEEGQ